MNYPPTQTPSEVADLIRALADARDAKHAAWEAVRQATAAFTRALAAEGSARAALELALDRRSAS